MNRFFTLFLLCTIIALPATTYAKEKKVLADLSKGKKGDKGGKGKGGGCKLHPASAHTNAECRAQKKGKDPKAPTPKAPTPQAAQTPTGELPPLPPAEIAFARGSKIARTPPGGWQ